MQTTLIATLMSFTFLLIVFLYNKKLGITPSRRQSIIIIICTSIIVLAVSLLLYLYVAGDGSIILEAVPPIGSLPKTTIFGSDLLIDIINIVVINLLVLNIFSFVKVFRKKRFN